MKKVLLSSLTALALGAASASAQLIITGVYDGASSDPKGIEIYVSSTQNYEGWDIGLAFNGSSSWSSGYVFGDGVLTEGSFLYITSTPTTLTGWGWDSSKGTVIDDGSFNMNGDDTIGVLDPSDNLVDIYGVLGTDGTGEAWEYTDSYAYRNDATGPSVAFTATEWEIGGVDFLESASPSQQAFLTDQFGTFTAVPEPSTYALLAGLGMIGFVAYRRRKAAAQA